MTKENFLWFVKNGKLINDQGKFFEFEILLFQPSEEKIALNFARNLKQLGIKARVRTIEASQYESRRIRFDYDMIINTWGYSLSPGREQTYYWSCQAATEEGSRNYAGIQDPVIDYLCDILATAEKRENLVAAAKALSRVLSRGYYVVPLCHSNIYCLAYKARELGHPKFQANVAPNLMIWWSKNAKRKNEWAKKHAGG